MLLRLLTYRLVRGQKLSLLEEKFREGIARVLDVPPEWVREDVCARWAKHFARAFVKPKYWKRLGL